MRRKLRRSRGLATAVAVALVLAGCWKDRGSPPGASDLWAVDVNAGGSILAGATVSGRSAGFVLEPDGEWVSIGALDPAGDVLPAAINDDGTVVGDSITTGPFGETIFTPFIWEPDTGIQPLDAVTGEDHENVAGISDGGHIVGFDGPTTAWIWDPDLGHSVELQPLPGHSSSVATAVNDAGWVVGESRWGDQPDESVVWAPPAYAPIALDRDGATHSDVTGIDDDGTMVGNLVRVDELGSFAARAVVWDNTSPHSVRYLDEDPDPDTFLIHSFAVAIDDGVIIGSESGCDTTTSLCPRDWQVAWDAVTLARTELYASPTNDHPTFAALDGQHLVGTVTADEGGESMRHLVSRGRPAT